VDPKNPIILRPDLIVSSKPMFTKYTFVLDLELDEQALLSRMKEKTRYNIRLAQKKGVVVTEETSQEGFKIYLQLMAETVKRDRFFAHSARYHQTMWDIMSKVGIAHLLIARHQNIPLAAWILFKFHDVLYYPYGTSSREYREVMAPNLLMWEAIKLGRKLGCSYFDMWGALGTNPDPTDPFFGFNRFKEGYGGKLVEFVGTYDLLLKPQLYSVYNIADKIRWWVLRLKQRFF
jgi:lipid II:glycine glycyltransferase (peptidoglycan interpeptide bridge formation enzyme)